MDINSKGIRNNEKFSYTRAFQFMNNNRHQMALKLDTFKRIILIFRCIVRCIGNLILSKLLKFQMEKTRSVSFNVCKGETLL